VTPHDYSTLHQNTGIPPAPARHHSGVAPMLLHPIGLGCILSFCCRSPICTLPLRTRRLHISAREVEYQYIGHGRSSTLTQTLETNYRLEDHLFRNPIFFFLLLCLHAGGRGLAHGMASFGRVCLVSISTGRDGGNRHVDYLVCIIYICTLLDTPWPGWMACI
jgi:hypothetical protein